MIGLLMILTNFTASTGIWVYLVIGSSVGMLIILMVYSYWVWKQDPDARTS